MFKLILFLKRPVNLVTVFILISWASSAQQLNTINYNYLYASGQEFELDWKIVHDGEEITIHYRLELTDTTKKIFDYDVLWDARPSLADKEGTLLTGVTPIATTEKLKSGKVKVDKSLAGQYAVARVIYNEQKRMRVFHKRIPTNNTPHIAASGFPVTQKFILRNQPVNLSAFATDSAVFGFHYPTSFPPASPPFATKQGRVAPVIQSDSIRVFTPSQTITLRETGLYLLQQDTASLEGVAFRVEDDYPKLGTLQSLAGPLIYVCTSQEYDKLKAAGEDKAQFDKTILSITGNAERARNFMRTYFRNVELANRYFTSYKEGWKTDRGMVYIIYGLPQVVYLLGDREVWEYNNTTFIGRFTFTKSPTIFDPENFVLIREENYRDAWYAMIDLWRKARF
ncbi:MAG: GWxTD domain-containing protein [Cyclobacteriaceae bacterium]|nr:GWxTD domain-containing protein [Cyclobacteriaceae bacterium]